MVAIYVGCVAAVGLAVLARVIAVLHGSGSTAGPTRPRTAAAVGPQSGVEREARHADQTARPGRQHRRCLMTRPMIRPPASVDVHSGPLLLSGIDRGPGLAAHRARLGALPEPGIQALVALLEDVGVRGRGGAGFPLARKLQTVVRARGSRAAIGGRRPYVVVNAAEGEPASAKDSALLDVAPHLVLDGAVVAARALGAGRSTSSAPRTGPGSVPRCTGPPPNVTTTASGGCSTRPRPGSCRASPARSSS